MSKYVCNYSEVTRAGKLLSEAAANMKSFTNKYSTTLNANLSKWEGPAKNSFSSSNDKQIEMMKSQAEYLELLGEFVKNASNQIKTQDEELAELDI